MVEWSTVRAMRSTPLLILVLVAACAARTDAPATPPRVGSPLATAGCSAEGSWINTTPDVGTSTITVVKQPDGSLTATEAGMANFAGAVKVDGSLLHVDFKTASGYAGWYEWTLDQTCSAGSGKLVFTAGGQGEHASSVKRASS